LITKVGLEGEVKGGAVCRDCAVITGWVDGLSIRALAGKHHVHRRTVRQALE
jgi:hypothetical protein